MKSHNLFIKIRPSLTVYKQNKRNLTSNCISIKLTDFWPKTLVVVLVAFSSFYLKRRTIKQDVSILISKTTTIIPWPSLESFWGMYNRPVSYT